MILERLRWLTWIFVLLFAVVDARLAHLQFVARDFWEGEARATREDGEFVPFRRGAILDRFGKPLAVGEIDQTLNLLYSKFRRETPLGQISAGVRTMIDDLGRSDLEQPAMHEILQQPERWTRALLSESQADLAKAPRSVRYDYWFYTRSLLGMTEKEFRAAREATPLDKPFSELVPDAIPRAVARIKVQADALRELAAAIGQDRPWLVTTIENKLADLETQISKQVAAARSKSDGQGGDDLKARSDAKVVRPIRQDYESRLQLLSRGIPYKAVFLVNTTPDRFAGFEIRDIDSRRYPAKYENIAPMLIGWVGDAPPALCEVTRQHELRLRELESREPEAIDDDAAREIEQLKHTIRSDDYRPEEQLGREGMEGVLEAALRGHRGWKRVKHDRAQRDVELLDEDQPIDGQDVRLTLDAELQLAAERAMEHFHHQGSVVLLDPEDGAIRAMATWPNPTREQIKNDYSELVEDKLHPLFHRAFHMPGNPPPPGSVFKLVVAAAGLESGVLGEFTEHFCAKEFDAHGMILHCLFHHGTLSLKDAIEKSCNVYFYETGAALGYARITDMARRFGIGTPSGFGDPRKLGLGGESRAVVEDKWLPPAKSTSYAFTLQSAIGQAAFDDITPLQVATFVAPFANGGDRVTPYLVDRIGDAPAPHTPPEKIGLKPSTIRIIDDAMKMVVEPPHGTARPENGQDLRLWRVAGKTGTPEVERGEDHAWFAGYFPAENPTLVFAFYAEAIGKHGGTVGRPFMFDLLSQPELESYVKKTVTK